MALLGQAPPGEGSSPAPCTGGTPPKRNSSLPHSKRPWVTQPDPTPVRKCIPCLESHPASPGGPQVMPWEGAKRWGMLSSHLPSSWKGLPPDVHGSAPSSPPSPLPYQDKGTGPSSLGRKYCFYLCTRKLWVALYETKITFFSIYTSWYNEGENQPPKANDTMPPSARGIYIKSKIHSIWVRI